jgi:CMP-N,N'-diacetyllegionaminic acid synthase
MIYCIIPARSGSKGVNKKNLQFINGKSLARISLEFAIDTNLFDKIILDTNDIELIDSVKDLQILIPHIRPIRYANDEASIIDSLKYLIFEVIKMDSSDTVVLLQPTCPFRTKQNLLDCFEKWDANKHEYNVATSTEPLQSPKDFYEVTPDGKLTSIWEKNENINRQSITNYVFITGSIYIFNPKNLVNQNSLIIPNKTISVRTSQKEGFDIDTEFDLQIARLISIGSLTL